MIRQLRRRFVVSAMIAVTALLLAVVGFINGVNLATSTKRVDQILTQLSDARGDYKPMENHRKPDKPEPLMRPSPDDMLGARFFWAKADETDALLQVDTRRIFAVTQAEAEELAKTALERGRPSGKLQQFRYRITVDDTGEQFLIFLDVAADSHQAGALFWGSLLAAAAGWLIMLPLVMALSKQAVGPIARNMEKQKQFVTNAGHELKTPLAIIMANTDALELHQGESKWSKNIRAQAVRLNGLMQNLLVLAKMDESGGQLALTTFRVDSLLDELLQPYLAMAEEKAVAVIQSIQPEVELHANRESITQLFSILLDNAVKYTPAGGKISIGLCRQGGKCWIQIANTAEMPENGKLEKLFDRFYRGDAARTQKRGGYGIGLSAAKTIVEAHKGSIQAKYEDGRMIFTVTM